MMVSLGVGGVAAGIMHLLAHGFFKALLFLGSGSVIHSCHHEQDIRKMGGLRRVMPMTFITYAIGMMALSGVPFFFSGAWTKEEILHSTAHWSSSSAPHYLMMVGVVLTALYMTRQMIYVFFGAQRESSKGAHESPEVMTTPLFVLAVFAIALSVVLTPAWPWLHDYLKGESAHVDFGKLIQPMLFISLLLVAVGAGLGILFYRNPGTKDPLEKAQPALFRFLENKMWIDELYAKTVVFGSVILSRASDWMDRYFWDGLVRAVGGIGQFLGIVSSGFDERAINAGVDEGATGTRWLGRFISGWHSGQVQTYMGVVAVGMLALLILYAWLA
jgi:NADH:ubiquinone oxidoreductase subunit 5 (subunit L)/multisubunit Na+/H+ antiporter MnhA subunit